MKLSKIIRLSSNTNLYSISPFSLGSFVTSTFGTFDNNTPVQIVNGNGNNTFFPDLIFPKNQYERGKCQCTFIASHGILALTDYDESSVCLYNTQTGHTVKVTDSQIEKPRGVCKGPNGSILVACVSSIVQLTIHGEVLTSVDVGMHDLQAINISRDWTQLVVSCIATGNCQLRLFEILK